MAYDIAKLYFMYKHKGKYAYAYCVQRLLLARIKQYQQEGNYLTCMKFVGVESSLYAHS